MAKPTTTVIWASDVNYTSGPFAGSPTKLNDPVGATEGSIPGEGIVAEFYNANTSIFGEYSQWVFEGTDQPDLTAHIVETDVDGIASIASGAFGATGSSDTPLVVTNNTGIPGSIAANIMNNGTGNAMVINATTGTGCLITVNSDTNPGILVSQSGDGDGIQSLIGFNDGRAGFFQATGAGTGIEVETNTGASLNLTSGSGNGAVITSTSGTGVLLNTGGGIGINSVCTNSGGIAVLGNLLNAGGSTFAAGVKGIGGGSAIGVSGESSNGYGGFFNSVNNVRAPLRLAGKTSDPSSTEEGDVFYNSTKNHLGYSYDSNSNFYVWGTQGGFVKGFNSLDTSFDVDEGTGYQDGLSMTISPPFEPKVTGYIEIDWGFRTDKDPGAGDISYRIIDVTDGNTPLKTYSAAAVSGVTGHYSHSFRYFVPLVGTRTFKLQYELISDGAPNETVGISTQYIKAIGMFPTIGG